MITALLIGVPLLAFLYFIIKAVRIHLKESALLLQAAEYAARREGMLRNGYSNEEACKEADKAFNKPRN